MTLYIIIAAAVVLLDQVSKYLAVLGLKQIPSFTVIEKVLNFTYVENRGAAFGMLSEHRWVFMTISAVVIIALTAEVVWQKPKSKLTLIALGMIVGGGIGNMIDRVALGYVVDFIDVRFIDFYVFNIADSFVCIGCGLMVIALMIDEVRETKAKKAAANAAAVSDEKANEADTSDGDSDG